MMKNILVLSDAYTGTLWWRLNQILDDMKFCMRDVIITNLTVPNQPYDILYYTRFDVIICHLTVNHPVDFIFKAKRDGLLKCKLYWSQDDLTIPELIADYILPKSFFQSPSTQNMIQQGIDSCDYVITTTPFLKNKIAEHYGKPLDKILLWPNMVSQKWFGDMFFPEHKKQQFKKHKQGKIRALFSGALNHLSFDCKYKDDLSIVDDTIDRLGDIMQFLIMSAPNQRIDQFNGKLVPVGGADLIHFPQFYFQQDADLMIAPLIDSDFNKCKSNIKVLEAAMLGVVPFAQRLEPYQDWLPDELLFTDAKELTDKLKDFSTWSIDRFGSVIIDNYNRFLKATEYYGTNINGFVADKNYTRFLEFLLNPEGDRK